MLNNIEKKQLARYERLTAIPKWKYVLLYGVVGWGIPVAILVSLLSVLLFHQSFSAIIKRELWINLAGFTIGGIAFGLVMRRFIPRQVRRLKEKESQRDPA